MAEVITGYAGCGKTYELIKRINYLIENNICLPYEILVLTTARDKEAYSKNHPGVTVWFYDELSKFVLKKAPEFLNSTSIPDYISVTIIGDICKDKFKINTELNALTKSETFFRELYNLFCLFKTNKINPELLKKIINESNITSTDKTRMNITAEVFCEYENILARNDFLDVRDVEISSLKVLKESSLITNTLKSRYKYIFADGFENISQTQLQIINLIADENKLCVTFDENSQIREFRGALDIKSLKNIILNFNNFKLSKSKRNDEILQRALFLVNKFNGNDYDATFSKTEKLHYKLFDGIQDEIEYIANDIKDKVKNKNATYSDFAILVRDFDEKQKFADILLTENIPVQNATENNNYKKFSLQFSRYIDMFDIFDKFNLKEFSPENLKKVTLPSKADFEILFDELNLYFENILSENLENTYAKDGFLRISEIQNRYSLINIASENLKILTEKDKTKLIEEFDFIKKAYELHKKQKYTELAILSAKRNPEFLKDTAFAESLGSFASKVNEICKLYEKILRKPVNPHIIKDLSLQTGQTRNEKENTVNLLTFFKTGGEEYKYVYIPCLTENNFPKKNKSTYFISFDSNKILSEEIRKISPSFSRITEEYNDGMKEETRLFYTGLTRAKEELLISTHTYGDKKQIPVSVFFQALIDKENLKIEEIKEKKRENETIIDLSEEVAECNEKNPVLKENEQIKLSASSIGNYQLCPKRFYFANLLNLKTSGNFEANYGTIVHAVFEVFNKTAPENYNKENILHLSTVLFNSKSNPEEAIKSGFSQMNIDLINATDDLSLDEMEEQFKEAINCLEKNGFFTEIPNKIETEKTFSFRLEEIPNVLFSGRIDAIYNKNGRYEIVDYKTGSDKKHNLSYYVSENGINFLNKNGSEPTEKSKEKLIS